MRLFYLIFLILLIISCTEKTIEITTADVEKAGVKTANIRTTKVDFDKNAEELQEPEINIVSPKNDEAIDDSRIIVILNISNFKLVTPDKYPQKGQGHVQVWFDHMEFRGSKTEFVFENESNGLHTIKAELMMSNNTLLPYSKTIKIFINKT